VKGCPKKKKVKKKKGKNVEGLLKEKGKRVLRANAWGKERLETKKRRGGWEKKKKTHKGLGRG